MSMFVGRETPSKHVMRRIHQNKSLGLGWVPLDAVAVMIMLRTSAWRLEQLLLSESWWETSGCEEGSRRMVQFSSGPAAGLQGEPGQVPQHEHLHRGWLAALLLQWVQKTKEALHLILME